jgi:hypothetical protein
MERFLLFDSDCGTCRRIAESIEPETKGWLIVRSLHDTEMQSRLRDANPNWGWKPALLEIEDEKAKAYNGIAMGIRFLWGLGIIRTWRIARHLHREGVLGYIFAT